MKHTLLFSFLALLTPVTSFAQDVDATAKGSGMSSMVIQFVLIFAIFYFLVIRPQQKKLKDHQEMAKGLSKGDKVITQGGIAAVISSAKDGETFIEVEIATGVKVNVLRSSVSEKVTADANIKAPSLPSASVEKPAKSVKKEKAKAKTKEVSKAKTKPESKTKSKTKTKSKK